MTDLTDEEVEEATEDPSGQIRIRALQELYTRGDKKVEKRALEVFEQRTEPWQVRVRARGALSTMHFAFNPLDAVGWKGTLVPVKLNWRDIRPVVSARYHLPPSVHSTFTAERFVVCTFCPQA